MELIPVKTKILVPPKDDLYRVLEESLVDLREGDIVLITSKVVSIHEGRCVRIDGSDKESLVREEADYTYDVSGSKRILTVIKNALISSSGIDESNGDGYYTLLPKDGFESAKNIYVHLKKTFNLSNVGVIITDSHSTPLRYGAVSISIGSWGIAPIGYHTGKKDLFGRKLIYSKTNIVDALAAAATLVSGECAESTPIVIARGVPNIEFIDRDVRNELFVDMEDDFYKYLFDAFTKRK